MPALPEWHLRIAGDTVQQHEAFAYKETADCPLLRAGGRRAGGLA